MGKVPVMKKDNDVLEEVILAEKNKKTKPFTLKKSWRYFTTFKMQIIC